MLDALPFLNTSVTLALSGRDLREAIEQGLSLQAGMVQVSGLAIEYDRKRPPGSRLVRCRVGADPLQDERIYRVSTSSFMAEGGDGYRSLQRGRRLREDPLLSDVLSTYVRAQQTLSPPPPGRLVMLQP